MNALVGILTLVSVTLAGRIVLKGIDFLDELQERKNKLEKELLTHFKVIVVATQFKEAPRFGPVGSVVTVQYGLIKGQNGKLWQTWTQSKGKTPVDKLNDFFHFKAIGTEKTMFKKYVERKPIGEVVKW